MGDNHQPLWRKFSHGLKPPTDHSHLVRWSATGMLAKVHFVWSPLLRAVLKDGCVFPTGHWKNYENHGENDDVLVSKPINQSKPSFPHHFPCHFPSDFPCFRLTSKLQGPDVLVCCSRAGNVYAEEWGAPLSRSRYRCAAMGSELNWYDNKTC